ncbi:MAG: UDP-N-acetylmuramoyl-L-alanine--D-glutamate ligase [Terriglobia bacterium]
MDSSFKGRKVLVVGMGRSGLAALDLLRKHGAVVTMTDSRSERELAAEMRLLREQGIPAEAGAHSEKSFLESDLVVLSPGVPFDLPPLQKAKAEGVPIIGELELGFRFLHGRIIAITGTNGKTTTTTLIGEILEKAGYEVQVGGNIGRALSSFALSTSANSWTVLEVSSFQLETAPTFRPDIAVFLNVTPDHLDRYQTYEDYFQAKLNLFRNQKPADLAVLNYDDQMLRNAARELHAGIYWFSRQQEVPCGVFQMENELLWRSKDAEVPLMRLAEIPLKGEHNVGNAAAAATAAALAKVPLEKISQGIRNFKGVEHRLEFVVTIAGVHFFNDSKATNIDAARMALKAFESGIILILGGRDKGSDFGTLAPEIRQRVKCVILLGEASQKIRLQLDGLVPIRQATTMGEAVELAFAQAVRDDTVLLAPACASFDMFENYEHRGREFKKAVNELARRWKNPQPAAARTHE